MGSAFQYLVSKKKLTECLKWEFINDKTEDEIKKELSQNFNPELYEFSEDKEWYCFELSEKIPTNDFIELYDEFNKIVRRNKKDVEEFEIIKKDISKLKSIYDISKYAKENCHCTLCDTDLPFYCNVHPFYMFGEHLYPATSIKIVSFYFGVSKISCEDSSDSFDVFTDLLRYRLKHTKLGESMLAFVTA